jgi:hypothetical protein
MVSKLMTSDNDIKASLAEDELEKYSTTNLRCFSSFDDMAKRGITMAMCFGNHKDGRTYFFDNKFYTRDELCRILRLKAFL